MDLEALERLGRLRDSGVLTDEEFAAEKQRVLSGSEPVPEAARDRSETAAADPSDSSDERRGKVVVSAVAGVILLGVLTVVLIGSGGSNAGSTEAVNGSSNVAEAIPAAPALPAPNTAAANTTTNEVSNIWESATNYDKDGDGKLDCPIDQKTGGIECTGGEIADGVREKCLIDNRVNVTSPPKDIDQLCTNEGEARVVAIVKHFAETYPSPK